MEIIGFAPNNGAVGTQVTLTLENMPVDASQQNTVVYISGSPHVQVNSVNAAAGIITVTIEQNAQSGEFVVLVDSQQGYEAAQSAEVFTVNQPVGQPQITNMTPRTAIPGQTLVTLNGQNLNEVEFVWVGSTTVMNIQHISNSTIRFRVPLNAPNGNQRVAGRSQEYGRINCPYMLDVQNTLNHLIGGEAHDRRNADPSPASSD